MGIQMDSAATAARLAERADHHTHQANEIFKPNERIVFDALCNADAPLKAYDLLEALHDQGLRAPMTIYRALDSLMSKGCVKKIISINAFVAVRSHCASLPRAFLICRDCSRAKEILLDDIQIAGLFSPSIVSADDICIEAFSDCHDACKA